MEYNIHICQWNANGVKNKMSELSHMLRTNRIHICLLAETKLRQTDRLALHNYTIHRRDMINDSGGTAILVHNSVPHVKIKNVNSTIQHIGIKFNNINLFAIYNTPRNIMTHNDLEKFFQINRKTIVAGDFNSRHTFWNNHNNNTNGNRLKSFIDNNNINLLIPDNHTHYPPNGTTPTTIDLILHKNINNISNAIVLNELNSDHLPVIYHLDNELTNNTCYSFISYKYTKWDKFRRDLINNITINSKVETPEEIDTEVALVTDSIQKAITKHSKIIHVDSFQHNPLPRHILNLIKLRNRLRRRQQRFPQQETADSIKELNNNIKYEIKIYKNTKYETILENIKPHDNTLWRKMKQLKRKYEVLPVLTDEANNTYTMDADKAEAFGVYFQSINNINTQAENPFQQNIIDTYNNFINNKTIISNSQFKKLITSPSEIRTLAKSTKNNKAPGLDKIPNLVTKNLPQKVYVQLYYIINAIIKTQHFPEEWKKAIIVPICKPGKEKSAVSNYRPISLTSTLAKLTERVILRRVQDTIDENNTLMSEQFGFRPQHNTTMQLVRVVNDITTHFNHGESTVMCLLDIEKAFDRVWIPGLIYKLIKLNFPQHLIYLINSFITTRRCITKVGGEFSNTKEINAGIPQGSALGPVLYTLYINDLPTTQNTNVALFADDTAIYSHAVVADDAAAHITLHLNTITEYYRNWKIILNKSKTELIILTRKYKREHIELSQPFRVDNTIILPSDTVKYLGIHFDKRLFFRQQVKQAEAKAQAATRYLYSLLKHQKVNIKNKKLIYNTIIRPILVYGAPVWNHISDTNLGRLQVFQNKILRLITGRGRYATLRELHHASTTPYIVDYIRQISDKFYRTQCYRSELTKHIPDLTINNINFLIKHKLPYCKLEFFNR